MTGTERGKTKCQKIIDSAMRLFARYGYKKTSLDEIAKSTGVVKGALYHYFPDKESLFATIVKYESEKWIVKLRSSVDNSEPPKQRLVHFIMARFSLMRDIAKEINVTKEAFYEIHSLLSSIATSYYPEEQKIISAILSDGIRGKVFKKIDVEYVSEIISNCLRSQEPSLVFENDNSLMKRKIRTICDLFLTGIEVHREAK
jgi:predicted DNA-binding protein YlxM (UPF0122 family)